MVLINIVTALMVFCGTLFYKFIYPKRNINLFVLLLIIAILPVLSVFRPGDYQSGDFNIHIYRIMSFYDSLMEGHLMPSWAGELNATYGNPLFIFNYSLPYYAVVFLHLLGLSFISGMKAYFGLNLYLSGVLMYLWIKKLTQNNLAAFTAAIFYLFNPYHLIDIHLRATLGESTIFTLAPLLLLFITYFIRDRKLIYLVLTALVCQLLFLAHPLVGITIFGIAILYVIYLLNFKKRFQDVSLLMLALFFGAIASIYCWVSFIIYAPYMFSIPGGFSWQFDQLWQLIYSSWKYGLLFQGPHGELSWIIGYTQILVIIGAIILLILNKITKQLRPHYLFWLLVTFLFLFFMTPYSKFIWSSFPLLLMLQSNRLLLPIALATSVLAGYLAITLSGQKKSKIFLYFLIFVTIAYTILNWGQRNLIINVNDATLRKNVWISTVYEGTTAYFLNNKWADINHFWFTKLPKTHLMVLQGKATVKELKRTSTEHYYLVDAKTPLSIQENTLYYPGWNLKSNGSVISIYPGEMGIINAKLPKGKQNIELYYQDIPAYAFAKLVSIVSFVGLVFLILVYYAFAFLPIHSISPGKRIAHTGLTRKTGLRSFVNKARKG